VDIGLRHGPKGSALPMIPQSVSRGARISGLLWFADCYGLSGCWPPCTDLTGLPANGGFYFQAFNGSVILPAAGYDYNSDWTPLLGGLSPAGMAASLAALVRPCVARELSSSWSPPPTRAMNSRRFGSSMGTSSPMRYQRRRLARALSLPHPQLPQGG